MEREVAGDERRAPNPTAQLADEPRDAHNRAFRRHTHAIRRKLGLPVVRAGVEPGRRRRHRSARRAHHARPRRRRRHADAGRLQGVPEGHASGDAGHANRGDPLDRVGLDDRDHLGSHAARIPVQWTDSARRPDARSASRDSRSFGPRTGASSRAGTTTTRPASSRSWASACRALASARGPFLRVTLRAWMGLKANPCLGERRSSAAGARRESSGAWSPAGRRRWPARAPGRPRPACRRLRCRSSSDRGRRSATARTAAAVSTRVGHR